MLSFVEMVVRRVSILGTEHYFFGGRGLENPEKNFLQKQIKLKKNCSQAREGENKKIAD